MTRMTGRLVATLVSGLVAAGAAAAQTGGEHGRHEERRDEWQKVPEIFEAMGVKSGAIVADVGAGDGFFTTRLARAVGADGRVMAVDIGAEPLRKLRARVAADGLGNVEVIEGAADDPKLAAGSLDAILIVNAYHEMRDYKSMLMKMKAALKPGGRLVIVEPIEAVRRGKSRDEQTRNHEIDVDFVREETRAAGFTQVRLQDPFTSRPNGHGDEWILVLTPAVAADERDAWKEPGLRIDIKEFQSLAARGEVLLLDVRDPSSFRQGHLPGATLMMMPEDLTPDAMARLRTEKRTIVTYCS